MSLAHDQKPPHYSDPSAADDISSLLNTALAVQESFSKVNQGLKRIDDINETHLLPRLIEADEKYFKLFNESRRSANRVYAAIQEFINVVLPIALDTQNSINDRVEVIKESASKIARSAQEDLRPYDQRVDALKSELQDIHGSLVEMLDREKKNKEQLLAELSQQRSNLAVDNRNLISSNCGSEIKENTGILRALFAGWFSARNAKQPTTGCRNREIEATKKDVAYITAEFDSVLKQISSLVQLFSSLVGKLGHFGAIWDKLGDDCAQLSMYLDTGNSNLDIDNTVQREIGIYEQIKRVLDDYRLRV